MDRGTPTGPEEFQLSQEKIREGPPEARGKQVEDCL